jgi:anti-sigma B factor antagonist
MEKMQASIHQGGLPGTSIIRLAGPLTLATQSVLEEALQRIGDADTIIDVFDVPYIDSAGLGTIIAHFSHTQRNGRSFAMTGVSRRIQMLLELTHVNKILPVYPTNADAERAFSAREV